MADGQNSDTTVIHMADGDDSSTNVTNINKDLISELEKQIADLEMEKQMRQRTHELMLMKVRRESELRLMEKQQEMELMDLEGEYRYQAAAHSTPAPRRSENDESLTDVIKTLLNESRCQTQSVLDTITAPNIELIKFNGDPLKYHQFLSAFDNWIERKELDDALKLNCLIQHCTGRPRELLECCLVKAPREGYLLARSLLKKRFGQEDHIAKAWLDKVLERPRCNNVTDLRSFADDLRAAKETLTAIGFVGELEARTGMRAIVEKLTESAKARWRRKNYDLKEKGKSPTLTDLLALLDRIVDEEFDPIFGSTEKGQPRAKRNHCFSTDVTNRAASGSSGQKPKPKCPMCDNMHYLNQCDKFREKPVRERHAFVMSKKLCVNCFNGGHIAKDCTKNWSCNIDGCGLKHNRWLHLPKQTQAAPDAAPDAASVFAGGESSCTSVGLPIVPVIVMHQTRQQQAYALLDRGSTSTVCTERLRKDLNAVGHTDNVELTTLHDSRVVEEVAIINIKVAPLNSDKTYDLSEVISREKLNVNINNRVNDIKGLPHLRDIPLADIDVSQVDLIIGSDHAHLLIDLETRTGKTGEPVATRTPLGWTVFGPKLSKGVSRAKTVCFTTLDRQVERFWRMDEPTQGEDSLSWNDKLVVSEWEKSICREGQHYSLSIPFKDSPCRLPNNFCVAKHRLDLLGKRLTRDQSLKEKYTREIKTSIEKGYAEEVPQEHLASDDKRTNVWYLPHHPVTHPHKPDRVRVVFDCSAKYNGLALNDVVHQGPDLLNQLLGVLLKFRQEGVAFMADIEAMFMQVKVLKEDRDCLRFLWWEDDQPFSTPKIFRMTSHLFGGIWSPSCANFALKRTAADHHAQFDALTSQTVANNFYVDDCLKSVCSSEEALRLIQQLREMLSLGGFRLTKFVSNSPVVMKSLPVSEVSTKTNNLDLDATFPTERALGVLWNVKTDRFCYDVSVRSVPDTKRGLLSLTSTVYDPFGFVGPFVIVAKLMFQELCRRKIDWDNQLPSDVQAQWKRWVEDLPKLKYFQVPRCLKPSMGLQAPLEFQLHHFSDASEKAFGAVSYLRIVDGNGAIHCSLVLSKSRLAPLKQSTIPRLELSAAVVATKLDQMLRRDLEYQLLDSLFWTDSTIVLHYVNNDDKRYQTFVGNRVAQIRSVSSPAQWKHVGTKENPADKISRGMTAAELVNDDRWTKGPTFLWKDVDSWPTQPVLGELPAHAEVKKSIEVYTSQQSSDSDTVIDRLLSRFSSWYKLKRVVAIILRIKDKLRKKPETKFTENISVEELRRAELAILVYVQKKMGIDGAKMQQLRNLSPTMSDGILVVGGRLANAPLPETAKHPVILPSNHHVSRLIVSHYHHATAHGGVERVLAEIRQRYWIVKGRIVVKQVLRSCLLCKKKRQAPSVQYMADLPKDRVTPQQAPFQEVGIDYFGPFTVKQGRSDVKRYGCVFTCLSTRAVHLEMACSLDTDSFINALERFIARRGPPSVIRSDNGTNFVGAMHELKAAMKECDQYLLANHLAKRDVQWIFNPPASSHMGGVWERQIRSIRSILLSLVSQQKLTDESLSTFFCIAEGIINGRPITKLSEDPSDEAPLTPNHLLLLRAGPDLPPGKFEERDKYRRRWRQVQYLSDVFWSRWIKEYLPGLQARQKWMKLQRNYCEGDLVLIVSENLPRYQWPLGLVTQVHPGRDGLVRSVQVKTQTGLFVRPIHKLCLLEAKLV